MHQRPQQTATIGYCYHWITSPLCAAQQTIGYRAMLPTATREQKSDFKILNFQYATFSGIFYYRDAKGKWVEASRLDTRLLSTETAGGFTGVTLGMFAVSKKGGGFSYADFKSFNYR